MRILFIGHEQDLNGASRSLLNIIAQIENDHEIFVLAPYESGPFIDALQKRKVTVLYRPYFRWCVQKASFLGWVKKRTLWHLYQNRQNQQIARELSVFCKENNIDLIHTNTGVIDLGARIRKLSGLPHVWHLREFADLDFHMFPLISRKRYEKQMTAGADRFICISNAICQHYDFLPASAKVLVYNGVDRSNILTERSTSDTVRLLIAGRISPEKGQWLAVCACQKLVERGIEGFVLNIAGIGDLGHPIPENLKDRVILLGQIKDMPALRKDIDVELVCSAAEAFGRVTAEAMLGGIPVIGSRSGGTVELIEEGITGYLYPKDDVVALADRLALLIENNELRNTMGKAAQDYAVSHFMIERCVQEILAVYKSLEDKK